MKRGAKAATKEAASKAMEALKELANGLPSNGMFKRASAIATLERFIEAAAKRLPTEESVDRDRIRKRGR